MGTEKRIALIGASGRMGRSILEAAEGRDDLKIVAAIVSATSAVLGKNVDDARELSFTADLAAGLEGADLAIDFSVAASALGSARECAQRKIPLLIGTTGIAPNARSEIAKLAENSPIAIVPNTSLGVAALAQVASRLSVLLGEDFDAEVLDLHHRGKVDSPSGTALLLADAITSTRGGVKTLARQGRRKAGEVGVFGLRGGDIAGEHTIYFMGPGERIELTHRVSSREVFARGAISMALRLSEHRGGGLLGLAELCPL